MEKPRINEETKFFARILVVSAGILALAHNCLPQDRTPTDEQRSNPEFIACVEYRLAHDEFLRAPGPQGMHIGPTDEEIAEDRCLDELFPIN